MSSSGELTARDPAPSSADARAARLAELTAVTVQDVIRGFGLDDAPVAGTVLAWACRRRARRLAAAVLDYDDVVGAHGLAAGGARAVARFTEGLSVEGRRNVPRHGPVLVVANHPGLFDTTALFAAVDRPDLRVVAADRPFLRALPHTSRHLVFIGEGRRHQMHALRTIAGHLADGGAVLTFPAGRIEPDPAVLPGAAASLDGWSAGVELVGRLAGGAAVVPAIVSGVLSPRALRHPLTRLRRRPDDRQWLAALLQILASGLRDVTVRVAFGEPLDRRGAKEAGVSLHHAVRAEARRLIERVPRR